MSTLQNTNQLTNQIRTTCPCCGLLCDDIIVQTDDRNALKMVANGCAKSIAFFEQILVDAKPTVDGKEVNLSAAIKKAAELLQLANQPLIAGLGTEVQGMRAVMQLADQAGATLDHMHSESSMRNTLVLQNSGWQVTTLTEVKNRVDLLVVIGTDIVSIMPQFFKRIIWNEATLFEQDTATREVVYLGGQDSTGNQLDTSAGVSPNGNKPTVLPCDITQLPEVVAVLNALIKGKNIVATEVAGISTSDLQTLADRLKAAKYSVITWAASAFKFNHAELLVQNITECISTLNTGSAKFTTRSAGLPLTSGDGDSSATNVATWISGYPLRNSFKRGYPEYNPYAFKTEQMLNTNEADIVVWISTFKPMTPILSQQSSIVIGHPNTLFTQQPDVFIPVRVPGLQQKGLMFRMDSSVTLPLQQIVDSTLPTLSQVCSLIIAELNASVNLSFNLSLNLKAGVAV